MQTYYQDDLGYFEFEVNDGAVFPDWDADLKVEFYDANSTLRFTATINSSPVLTKYTSPTSGNKSVYVSGLDLSTWALGSVEAWIYAEINDEDVLPQPTKLTAFKISEEPSPAVPTPDPSPYVVGEDNWIVHNIRDLENTPALGISSSDMLCYWWNRLYTEFQTKTLNSENFLEVGYGEYRILYDYNEVGIPGPFVSLLVPNNTVSSSVDMRPSKEIYTITTTVSGCTVSGQLIDFEGKQINEPVEITLENLYNPTSFSWGSVASTVTKIYFDSSGYLETILLPGLKLRIGIGGYGITGTVTIPDQSSIDIFKLLEGASDEFEPR